MVLNKGQEEALKIAIKRYKEGEAYTCIAGPAGSGKAQPIDTIIPTPTGNKKLGELQVGDYVFDRLGQPTKILGVYPQGLKQQYQIIFSDGRTTLCASDHLWSYYTSKGNLSTKSTQELLESGLKVTKGYKYKIPTNKAIQYPTRQYELDPYFIGVFLGDGCCKERYLTLSSETEEIPNIIGNIINAKPIKSSEKNYNWTFEWLNSTKTISWICGNGGCRQIERKKPKTLDYFENYKEYLIQCANLKDIPPEYKYGDIEQRLALVQGLMDTDGSINSTDEHRYNMKFTSTSLKLVKSLQEILFSLGYSSTIHIDKREEKYTNNICYNLHINIPNEEKYKFFKLSRKKNIALEAKQYKKRRDYGRLSIVDIIPLKTKSEMVCIYVDNEEHLYLTNDFIVTHNTTLIPFIIDALNIDSDKVIYASFTGKACQVLKQKGCQNAVTLHKLLYKATPKKDGTFMFIPKDELDEDYSLIVIDEISMVSRTMFELLLSHGIHVLCLGDDAQLPPICADDDNHVLDNPHYKLTEILRQAQESEIIRLATHIREGKPLYTYQGEKEQVLILNKNELTSGTYTWANQILCAKNDTRIKGNQLVRQILGFGDLPESNDKIISLRNHWDFFSEDGEPLTNGCIGKIINYEVHTIFLPHYIYDKPYELMIADFETDWGDFYHDVPIDYQCLLTGQKTLNPKQEFQLNKNKNSIDAPFEFSYSNFITTWKAQGSEFGKVLLFEENFPRDRIEKQKYLYTGITRAKDKIVLVK